MFFLPLEMLGLTEFPLTSRCQNVSIPKHLKRHICVPIKQPKPAPTNTSCHVVTSQPRCFYDYRSWDLTTAERTPCTRTVQISPTDRTKRSMNVTLLKDFSKSDNIVIHNSSQKYITGFQGAFLLFIGRVFSVNKNMCFVCFCFLSKRMILRSLRKW